MNPDWIENPVAVKELLQDLRFRPDIVQVLYEAAIELTSSVGTLETVVDFSRRWFRNRSLPLDTLSFPLWAALVLVSAFPHVVALHQSRQISPAVTSDTLRDLETWMDSYRSRHGVWGLEPLHFLWNHVQGKLFTVGRLQYAPTRWSYPFIVFEQAGSTRVMAADGLFLSGEGWPQKSPAPIQTTLEESNDRVRGHEVDPQTGAVALQPTTLSDRPRRVLSADDPVLNIHIPAGQKLTKSTCEQSFWEALIFFDTHFPKLKSKAFICASWLLDRELGRVLPPHSGILQFGSYFYPMILKNADDRQIVERVLNTPANPPTTLQRAIRAHQHAGGKFKLTGGFLLREKLPSPSSSSQPKGV